MFLFVFDFCYFQNADIFAGLESLDDFHTRSSDANEHLGNTSDIATASGM